MAESIVIDREHPWPWLDAYTADAAAFFNGRDEDTARLLGCVLAAPATVFFGKSGLGKTSLVQAGLGHRLHEKRLFPVMVRTRGTEATGLSRTLLDALLASAQSAGLKWSGRPLADDDPRSAIAELWELLHESDGTFRGTEGARWSPVFVLDQFEEVFTLIAEPARRKALFDELGDLIEGRVPPEVAQRLQDDEALIDRIDPDRLGARFVLSLREDFLPDLETWADRIPRLGPNRCRLLPMTQQQALGAVTRTGGSLVQAEDARRIVDFLGHQGEGADLAHRPQAVARSVEPALLSLVCAGLNQDRLSQKPPGTRLDTRDLAARGGRLLETFYDDGIAALPPERRELAQGLIERELITSSGTRRPFPRRDIGKSGLSDADLDLLTNKRLLRIENTEQGDYIELVHDRVAEVAAVRAAQSRERAERAAREAELVEEARRKRQRRNLYWWVTAIVMAVTLVGLGAVLYQWKVALLAKESALALAREATALRLVGDGVDMLEDRRLGGTLKGALTLLAGHRLAQASKSYAQARAYGALQHEAEKEHSLLWLRELAHPVVAVAFSPDGARIVSGSKDDTLHLWNAGTGEPIGAAPRIGGQKGYNNSSVAFSPDGSRIVSGSWDDSLRLWDGRTGVSIGEPLKGQTNDVLSVAFSPDGARIVSGSDDNTLRLWDARTGLPIGEPLTGHTKRVVSVAFSPDSARIVSGSDDNTLRLWEARTGLPIGEPLRGHTESVLSVAFSPDGARIASGSYDTTLRLWDARAGVPVGEPLKGHTNSVLSVAFSPDGARIVSSGWDKNLRLWDARTGLPIGEPIKGHSNGVTSVAFSPDGAHIVSGSRDGTLRLWHARPGVPISEPLKGHTASVKSVALSPDGTRIASGSDDKTLRLWDARTGLPIGEPLKGHTSLVKSVAISPDGARMVSGSFDNTLRLWDARTGALIGRPLEGHSKSVLSVAFSPDGARIVSAGEDRTLRLWDAYTGSPIGEPIKGHLDRVVSVAFSPDGARIVSGSSNTLRMWDARTGAPIDGPLKGQFGVITSLAFNPDGTRIASNDAHTLRLWDARTGAPLGEPLMGHADFITSVAFSPDGARIVSGSRDHTLRLWDARTGAPVGEPLTGHKGPVQSVAFSPDGARIVSGSDDKTLRLWDVLETWADSLCAKLPRNMSRKEWREWVSPEFEYVTQCPGKPIPVD